MFTKFDFNAFKKEVNTTSLNESSVTSNGLPARAELYNLIRGKMLNIYATNPIDVPRAKVFGKIRTIDAVSALEYSQKSDSEPYVSTKSYTKGEEFKFLQTIYVVNHDFEIDVSDKFLLVDQIDALEDRGFISVKQLAAEFGVSSLTVVASNQKSTVAYTQEFLEDLEASFSRKLLMDSLSDSASERINREMVRFMEDTSAVANSFIVTANDYNEARMLASRIVQEARQVQKDTGNVVTYALVTPGVEALLAQSGLIDVDGFIHGIEIVSTRWYHVKDKEYVILGFSRDQDDVGDNEDSIGDAPYKFGSIILCPYHEDLIEAIDVESMTGHIMVQRRFGLSVAPYQKETKTVLGGDVQVHAGKNLNARIINVEFPVVGP